MVLKRLRDDGGAVAIMVSLMSVMLFVMAALVVDLGIARDNRRQAQNTADAAALAAANVLYGTTPSNLNRPADIPAAVAAAKSYAAENYGTTDAEWAACSTDQALAVANVAGTNCISFDQAVFPRNVLVVVPLRKQPSLFGSVIGYTGVSVGALAQTRLDMSGRGACLFCVIQDVPNDIQNGTLIVKGGNAWINGDVTFNPQGTISTTKGGATEPGVSGNVYITGDVNNPGNIKAEDTYTPKSPRVLDPLIATELPFAAQSSLTAKSDPCTDGPGVYGDFRSNGGTCTLQPGMYVFTGTLTLAGNGDFVAKDVTMYFTCGTASAPRACNAPGEMGGTIDLSGNGNYVIEAPTAQGEMQDFAIVFDRYNTSVMNLTGNGATTVAGTVYAVNAKLDNRGNGTTTYDTTMVVVGSMDFSGANAQLIAQFDPNRVRGQTDGIRGLVR